MPTYDYKCKKCGHTFEEFQTMSAKKLVICPSCGKPGLVRLMSTGTSLVFKGSGFYQTDYKKSGSSTSSSSANSKSESPSTEKNSGSSADTAKSESKPATPPPSPSKPDPK